MPFEADPSLLQDFITEAAELIEQLDADLVKLEAAGSGPQAAELLNTIFRSLHTVKGAAGFLGLGPLIAFAHAAEDGLNRLRKGDVAVTPTIMDALLRSVDVLREMTAHLAAGSEVPPCPEELIEQLHAIAAIGAQAPAASPVKTSAPQAAGAEKASAEPAREGKRRLAMSDSKRDLLSFMAADLRDGAGQVARCAQQARQAGTRSDAAANLAEIAEAISKTAAFFEVEELTALVRLLAAVAAALPDAPDETLTELLARLAAVGSLLGLQADAMAEEQVLLWPLEKLERRIADLAAGKMPEPEAVVGSDDAQAALIADGVIAGLPRAATAPASPASPAPVPTVEAPASASAEPTPLAAASETSKPAAAAASGEQTIRVEVGRLEDLLNLVGQLVLTKNRLMGLSRRHRQRESSAEFLEELNGATNDLDRLTGNLQVGVMRARMQPMVKLFDRYPRVIRDIARNTGKKIDLEIQGKETEVDKSVLELLADPLVHMLRNSADHGVETPEKRLAAGKPETGLIRLSAEHHGNHVRVEIFDDGRGLDRQLIGRKAVERGLATAQDVAAMSDAQVYQFIFAPGFSTAETISDLSGRGVGMDVVRTNIARLNGTIHLRSEPGRSTTIEVLIPLTVAIMPAMLVGVGSGLYAVPLTSIVEIVRDSAAAMHRVGGQPVLRLRDSVLPVIDLRTRLGEASARADGGFMVVVAVGTQRAGLTVDRLVGQQEIVIKPLEDGYTAGGPFSGATILEDGDVSLILDVVQLLRDTRERASHAA